MGKKIVITGVNGFIGSHMAGRCLRDGCDVIGIDVASTAYTADITYHQLNLYEDTINEILAANRPFALIHCAGMADVNYSVQHPDSDFISNVVISRKVLYAVKDASDKTRVIFLSSASVYGNPVSNPIDENHAKKPISPYALHKTMVEDMCEYFVRQYDMDIRVLRVFSAYGVGLKKQIFWDMGQKIKKHNRLELFGTGEETRDFIYIDDLVRAIWLVMETEKTKDITYNVANGAEISIKEVAEIFCEKCGLPTECLSFNQRERQGNPINWCADIKRIRELGYEPKININVGIGKYVEWLRESGII